MTFEGVVIHGQNVAGPCYGFPTANLDVGEQEELGSGIYAGYVDLCDEKGLPCVVCYGAGVLDSKPKFEVHILDWSGDLYGKRIKVKITKIISAILPFRGINELRAKVKSDIEAARQYFASI